ncbi:MAG: hypothetical protein JWN12_530 [Candidatus Saccharibacteria bacterium]|nr:hypothetical protein [Candidatus Saccharibacteria bacterium]
MWKFGRKKPLVPESEPRPEPEAILIDGIQYEALINKVFDAAIKKAEGLKSGEKLNVALEQSEIPAGAHYMEIVGPITMRSMEHGLLPGRSFNWDFEFTKM